MRCTVDKFRSQAVRAKRLTKPVYIVYGDEPFFIADAVDVLREVFRREAGPEAAVETFVAEEVSLASVLDDLRTEDFFQTRRLVVLTAAGEVMKSSADVLLRYLESPGSSSTLVLTSDKLPGSRKLVGAIDEAGVIVECKGLYENKLPQWLIARAKDDGYQLAPRAAARLVELVGTDLFKLASELSKVYLYAGERTKLTSDDVHAVVAPSREYVGYELTEALLGRDTQRTMRIADKLLEEREAAYMILVVVGRSLRRLWRMSRDPRLGPGEIGMHPYAFKKLKVHARRFREDDFRRANRLLVDTDRALKTTGMDARVAIEGLLTTLMAM